MNKGMTKPWILVAMCAALAGCATPQTSNSILSAADAERMITIHVEPSMPEREPELIAAVNPVRE